MVLKKVYGMVQENRKLPGRLTIYGWSVTFENGLVDI